MALPPAADPVLHAQNAELRARLEEAEETLRAIRAGEVDALVVVAGDTGPRIFTLQGVDAEQNRSRGEMLAQVGDAVIAVDTRDRITFLNNSAERQYGVRANEVLGRTLNHIFTSHWPSPAAEAGMATALGERGQWRGELMHRARDGRELRVESNVTALRGPDGESVGVLSVIRDVTERKQLESEKTETLRLLDTLLTHAPVGFVFLDRELRFMRINERLAEINGYSVAGHLGKTVAELLPTLEPALRKVTEHILATGEPVLNHEFTGETARAPGVTRWWSESWYPVHGERNEIVGFGAVVLEITERRKAEAALHEAKDKAVAANAAKDRFLATLSHELRTPLTPVLIVSQMHEESTELSAEVREDFAMIHRNIVLEAQLIDDLLDVSRIQQGKMRFDFKLVDVPAIIARTLEMLRSEIGEKGIAVRQELRATPATITADPARLQQVLTNLLRNAVKFTPRGGSITVRTAREQSDLHISLADTGAGIAAEDLERIFQPFEQVEAQQQSEHRSLGLGLAISAAIVAAHRGRIWAESPGPSQGATFHVRLPFQA